MTELLNENLFGKRMQTAWKWRKNVLAEKQSENEKKYKLKCNKKCDYVGIYVGKERKKDRQTDFPNSNQ